MSASPRSLSAGVRQQWRIVRTAVMFLTRIPVPATPEFDAEDLARCTVYFPLVGLLVGGIAALVYALAALLWSPLVAVALTVAAATITTGAFHEDGLADTFDGFGGWRVDDKLAIMTDSRMGTYGTVALVLILMIRVAALSAVAAHGVVAVGVSLVGAHVLARWSSLPLIRWMRYVQHSNTRSRPFAASVTGRRLLIATIATAVILAALFGPGAWLPALAAGLTTAGGALWLHRHLGGMTGDGLGAVNALTETAVYLALASSLAAWP